MLQAAACIVDETLGLAVVPNTKIVKLASAAFHYSKVQKLAAKAARPLGTRVRQGVPLKVGSLQVISRPVILIARESALHRAPVQCI